MRTNTATADNTMVALKTSRNCACSSPYAMAGLVGLKDRYDVAFGNDPDSDRHGAEHCK